MYMDLCLQCKYMCTRLETTTLSSLCCVADGASAVLRRADHTGRALGSKPVFNKNERYETLRLYLCHQSPLHGHSEAAKE